MSEKNLGSGRNQKPSDEKLISKKFAYPNQENIKKTFP